MRLVIATLASAASIVPLYFLVLAGNGGALEGSWGLDSAGNERSGPMGGASGQCGHTAKTIVNSCP